MSFLIREGPVPSEGCGFEFPGLLVALLRFPYLLRLCHLLPTTSLGEWVKWVKCTEQFHTVCCGHARGHCALLLITGPKLNMHSHSITIPCLCYEFLTSE